jgi:hypothetical protein
LSQENAKWRIWAWKSLRKGWLKDRDDFFEEPGNAAASLVMTITDLFLAVKILGRLKSREEEIL